MIKVSIIVPIYNTRKYLKKCIDSLINQTEKNIEIILINDGSKENVDDIIKEYNDKRIKYFKRTNHGIGATRNFGIDKSNGEYLMFIDSDDYILPNCVFKMYEKAIYSKCDLIISDFYKDKDNTLTEVIFNNFNDSSLKENINIINDISLGPCNKLYEKDLIIKNNIKFEENLKYEDAPFVIKSLIKANRIGKINECLSVYVIHEKSETTTLDKRVFDILKISDIILKEMNQYAYLNEAKVNLIVMILSYYIMEQKYVNDKKDRNLFIDLAFKKLNNINKEWKKCNYIKKFSFFKRKLKTSNFLTKIYCSVYNTVKIKSYKD